MKLLPNAARIVRSNGGSCRVTELGPQMDGAFAHRWGCGLKARIRTCAADPLICAPDHRLFEP